MRSAEVHAGVGGIVLARLEHAVPEGMEISCTSAPDLRDTLVVAPRHCVRLLAVAGKTRPVAVDEVHYRPIAEVWVFAAVAAHDAAVHVLSRWPRRWIIFAAALVRELSKPTSVAVTVIITNGIPNTL